MGPKCDDDMEPLVSGFLDIYKRKRWDDDQDKDQQISEAAYPGNIGFEEMVLFYRLANKIDLKNMEKAIDKSNWKEFKKLIEKVTGVGLK